MHCVLGLLCICIRSCCIGYLLRPSLCCAALSFLCMQLLDSPTSASCLAMPDKAVVGRVVLESDNKAAVQRLVSMEERWAYAYSLRKLLVSPFQVRHW